MKICAIIYLNHCCSVHLHYKVDVTYSTNYQLIIGNQLYQPILVSVINILTDPDCNVFV